MTKLKARDELFPWGWDAAHRCLRVQVFGASGGVGRELVKMLLSAGHPPDRLGLFGRRPLGLAWQGRTLSVSPLDGNPSPGDLAFLCTPPLVARRLARHLAPGGCRIVDLSGAFREDPDVPLVVPEINGGSLGLFTQLVAAPDGTAVVASLPLAGLDQAFGIEDVVVTSLEGASGAGLAGLMHLRAELGGGGAPDRGPCFAGAGPAGQGAPGVAPGGPAGPPSPFPAALARNLIPAIGDVDAGGTCTKERRFVAEVRRLLGRAELGIEITAVQVPVERCHAVSVSLRLGQKVEAAACAEVLAGLPGLRVDPDPHGPRPLDCAGTDLVHVGRIRAGTRGAGSLCFFAVGDQLRKGAALNALQVASRLPVV